MEKKEDQTYQGAFDFMQLQVLFPFVRSNDAGAIGQRALHGFRWRAPSNKAAISALGRLVGAGAIDASIISHGRLLRCLVFLSLRLRGRIDEMFANVRWKSVPRVVVEANGALRLSRTRV